MVKKVRIALYGNPSQIIKGKGKGKGPVLDIALLHDEHMLRSALQSWKWQLIGMS